MRTGEAYVEALDDGRCVYIEGELVRKVASHRAFAGAVRSVAHLYDLAADQAHAQTMTVSSPRTGRPVNAAFSIPHSEADLTRRRRALKFWSEASFGLLGRGPDCGASFVTGFAAHPEVFAEGSAELASNVVRFWEEVRDHDQYVTYAIVPPQIDRSRPAHQQVDRHLYAGVSAERDDGVVLTGAQQLATGAAVADWVYLSCITPLGPGDEAYAVSAAVRVGSPGVKVYSRGSFAGNDTGPAALSTRFDETDALIVFDDVFVPWEHIFVYRDIEVLRGQWTRTLGHVLGNHQAQIRLWTKLDTLVCLTARFLAAQPGGIGVEQRTQLGKMAASAALISGLVLAQEQHCEIDAAGVAWPGRAECFAAMTLQSDLYPEMLGIVREACGDTLESAMSLVVGDRVGLLGRLLWDLVGSEFAGRHHQYEMFYAGAPFIVKMRMCDAFDFSAGEGLVERALGNYDLGGRRRNTAFTRFG